MIKIKEAVIVEGRYDRIKLKSLIDAPIICTNGFRVFKDREKQSLIRNIALKRGILIMTDSDSAGFVIRNFLKGAVPPDRIKNCYIPQIKGKEKRKEAPSRQGLIGVEGLDDESIITALKQSGATIIGESVAAENCSTEITKQHFYSLGLTGGENSKSLRTALLKRLNLPCYLTANAMIEALNCLLTPQELEAEVEHILKKQSL